MTNVLIETPRLYLRRFTLADAPAVLEFGSHPEINRYTADPVSIQTLRDAEAVIREGWLAEYETYGYARWALVHKGDDRVIGFCGIKFEKELGLPDLGYRMLPEYWGQGLATEAARATLEYARDVLGLSRVVGDALEDNPASIRVLVKVGMKRVATYELDGRRVHRHEVVWSEPGEGASASSRK